MAGISKAEKIYKSIKSGVHAKFSEKKHCMLIINVMSRDENGTMAAFCVEAGIGDTTFYRWLNNHDVFRECYRYGCMISQHNWDSLGTKGMYLEDFNIEVWKVQGAARYGVGKTNRVRLQIDADANPYDQYKQLVSQASNGDFTAGELKQLMESINIGCRTFEQFELQQKMDEMKEDLKRMIVHSGNDTSPIASTTKTN